jgi:hypothetical protein
VSLIESFGNKFDDKVMVDKTVNSSHGHIVGTIMRKVVKRKQKGVANNSEEYEVAWDHSALGESIVDAKYLLDACITGSQIATKRNAVSYYRRVRR